MAVEQMTALLTAATTIACLMIAVWLLSLILKDASIVDIAWGAGFVCVAWAVFLRSDGQAKILLALTSIWGLRLTAYLAWRNIGHGEDYRYQAMRRRWGNAFPILSLIVVFGLQGVVMWVVSLPVQSGLAAATDRSPVLLGIGTTIWLIGILFESIGDWQLATFKRDSTNEGKVMDRGLWRYTRHPNYFGDFMVWWGLYIVALSQGAAWWTAIGPAVMSYFLMRVSGVTLLEKSLNKTKPKYADYTARTNAFFPWKPGV